VQSGLFDVLMTSLNIADQEAIDLTLPLAVERGMGVIVKRPLANLAWTTGATPAGEPSRRYWTDGYTDVYTERLKRLDYDFLTQGDVSHAVSLALQFTLSMTGVASAIVGTTNPKRLPQNADLLQARPLNEAQIAAIRARWHDVADASWIGQG
jgi:aryl-alcohol dehydrogenase-like predicted oxidoreductase